MGQVQENTGGSPTKMGQIGAAQGEAIGPRLGQLMLTALPNVGMVVSPRFNVLGGRFGTFHMGMKHFPNAPLLFTYKRRLPPPHLNNTQRNKGYTTIASFQRS
jgi:hypothetical protein